MSATRLSLTLTPPRTVDPGVVPIMGVRFELRNLSKRFLVAVADRASMAEVEQIREVLAHTFRRYPAIVVNYPLDISMIQVDEVRSSVWERLVDNIPRKLNWKAVARELFRQKNELNQAVDSLSKERDQLLGDLAVCRAERDALQKGRDLDASGVW